MIFVFRNFTAYDCLKTFLLDAISKNYLNCRGFILISIPDRATVTAAWDDLGYHNDALSSGEDLDS